MTVTKPGTLHYKRLTRQNSGEDKEQLKQYLQYAAMVEFATIPPYLTALYSLQDKTSTAYQVIRSIVLEEMLHLNLASNLMNAIGASPRFVGQILSYPNTILDPVVAGPYVQLMAASTTLMRETFMAIEQPLPVEQPQPGQPFKSIGQFYMAIEQMFEDCVAAYGESGTFTGDPALQRTNYYFGSGGGKSIAVTNLDTAKKAIKEISQQGEGAPPRTAYVPGESYGNYNQYGNRNDGTYGPILGTPYELSHYFKFKALADGINPLPAVYPMLPNPSPDKFQSQCAQGLANLFNDFYGVLVRTLETTFNSNQTPDPYFTVVATLMQAIFPTLATQLMKTPVLDASDLTLGPTAGPCFQYSDTKLKDIKPKIDSLRGSCRYPSLKDTLDLDNTLDTVEQALDSILGKLEGSSLKQCL